tara:strand:- start:5263 stop:5529 length:267 start_codon:yes stop_codon:yes gene_type:complete
MCELYCCVCATKIRELKDLPFLGYVCSTCFRMSKKNYYELVEEMSQLKIKMILKECEVIRHKEKTQEVAEEVNKKIRKKNKSKLTTTI